MNTSAKLARIVILSSLVAALGLACDFQKIGNQASATNVVVATLLTTPPVTITPQAVALQGLDASIPTLPDGGALDLDAGALFADAGFTLPPQTLAVVFFGNRGSTLDIAPTGITGAQVSVTQVGGKTWPLQEGSGGSYQLFGEDAGFTYTAGATYDFDVKNAGQTFTAELEKAPPAEHITQFHPAAGYLDQTAGQDFTFVRPDPPAGQDRALGFVTVFPVSQNAKGDPTYTNVPKTPLAFLKLIAAPSEWRTTSVTIPGTAFPEKDHNYIIILQSAKLGGPKTDNLFSGSAILGGTSDVAVVKTKK
jgi:hypothetical protein